MKTILVAGGTGFIGKQLIEYLIEKGYKIHALTRDKSKQDTNTHFFHWDIEKEYIDIKAFEGVSTIINLTGANIGEKTWTSKRKKEIIDSRIQPINLLYKYVTQHGLQIETLISSSAVGYYGAVTTEQIFTETTENGSDFLATVCREWEQTALHFEKIGTRVVILRKGVVFGQGGGILKVMAPLVKLGINVSIGKGNQYLPWIDLRDLNHIYDFILTNNGIQGVFNAVASEHITMNDFSNKLLSSYGKKSFLPNAPAFMVKLALGEQSVMLLNGTRVSNEKLLKQGFELQYDTLSKALGST